MSHRMDYLEKQKDTDQLSKIDLTSLFRDVLRQWWVVLIFALSVSFTADLWSYYSYQPLYTTKTTFIVTSKGLNANIYNNLETTNKLAKRFSEILNSRVLKYRVTKDLGLDTMDVETSAQVVGETNMMELRVTGKSSAMSYKVLQSVMDNYDYVADYIIDDAILETIELPKLAAVPDNPRNEKMILLKSFLLGLAVGAGLVLFLSYMRDTVKNEQDFRTKIDTKLLGSVFHEKKGHNVFSLFQSRPENRVLKSNRNKEKKKKSRKQESMLIDNPMRSFAFVESNKMTDARILSRLEKRKAKVVLITSVMENEGKSTVAANLALSMAMEHKNVMLIDCDFRKPSLYKIFQIPEEDQVHLRTALAEDGSMTSLIGRWKESSLYTLFNTDAMALETLLENGLIKQLFDFAREKMDYVVIDSAPMALISDTEELAQMADASVIILRQDMVLAKDINDAIDILNKTHGRVIGGVFNDVEDSLISGYAYGKSYYSGYGGGYRYGRYGRYGRYAEDENRNKADAHENSEIEKTSLSQAVADSEDSNDYKEGGGD